MGGGDRRDGRCASSRWRWVRCCWRGARRCTCCAPGTRRRRSCSRREPIARAGARLHHAPGAARRSWRWCWRRARFAADSLGLKVGDSYTTFSQLDSDTLALVALGGAQGPLRGPTPGGSPSSGTCPTRGSSARSKARDAMAELEREGLRHLPAPHLRLQHPGLVQRPARLARSCATTPSSLAGTVVHELLHNTLYLARAGDVQREPGGVRGLARRHRLLLRALRRGVARSAAARAPTWHGRARLRRLPQRAGGASWRRSTPATTCTARGEAAPRARWSSSARAQTSRARCSRGCSVRTYAQLRARPAQQRHPHLPPPLLPPPGPLRAGLPAERGRPARARWTHPAAAARATRTTRTPRVEALLAAGGRREGL